MFQEAEGRSDAAIKETSAEAVSETIERHPGALGGATAAALRSAERVRSCQLHTTASSGQSAKQPTARVTSGAHRPTALGERQLRRLLGALRAWSRRSSRRRLERLTCKAASGDGLFVRTAPPRSVNGSCSGSWERCTSAELPAKPRRWRLFVRIAPPLAVSGTCSGSWDVHGRSARTRFCLYTATIRWPGSNEALGDCALFERIVPPLLVSGSCSGF